MNKSNTEPLSKEDRFALAKFAEKNNLSVSTVINRILSLTINSGTLTQAIAPPFATPVNPYSEH